MSQLSSSRPFEIVRTRQVSHAEHLRNTRTVRMCWLLALHGVECPWPNEVAKALHVPMDIFLVPQARRPGHEELAMGAVRERRPPCHQTQTLSEALAYPTRRLIEWPRKS